MAMAKSHKFFHKNPTASAPNDNSFAVRFKTPSITGAALSPNFASALANLLVACTFFDDDSRSHDDGCYNTRNGDSNHREATEVFFDRCLNRSNRVRSLFCASSSTMF